MVDQKDFQKRLQRIGELVHNLESIADPASRAASKELVQLLMDLHGSGLEKMLEIVFLSGDQGARIIDELGQDPLVSSLLVLYGIHPEDLQTRVDRKLREIDSKLHKMGAEASLVSVNGGDIRLRLTLQGSHACGSTTRMAQTLLEEAIYEAAPDLTSLVVEGLEQPAASGFVGLEKLLAVPNSATSIFPAENVGSEGMD